MRSAAFVLLIAVLLVPVASAVRVLPPRPIPTPPPEFPRPLQTDVAFIVRDPAALEPGTEIPVRDRLAGLGYAVIAVAWTGACGYDYAAVLLVVVGTQTDPNALGCLNGLSKSILDLRAGNAVVRGLGANPAATGYPSVQVVDAGHAITQGIALGWHTICTAPGFSGYIEAVDGPVYRTLARPSYFADGRPSDDAALLVREAAPKRAFLGWSGYETLCQQAAFAWDLFDRAVQWLAA